VPLRVLNLFSLLEHVMTYFRALALVISSLLLWSSCTDGDDITTSPTSIPPPLGAVYGADDRLDYFEQGDRALQVLTDQSIVALIPAQRINVSGNGEVSFDAPTLNERLGLCAGEAFANQPTAASCSGTLIDDDLVMTAGHCVENLSACQNFRYVFRYYYETTSSLARITQEDVFSCRSLVAIGYDGLNDWAIVQLDRPAAPRFRPAAVESNAVSLPVNTPLTIIGFGSGLPAKIDSGGVVVNSDLGGLRKFSATTDSFGGNSGSGVFNRDRKAVGILVAGAPDYETRNGCTVAARYDSGGETLTYAFRAIQGLCATGHPSSLCTNNATTCGDSVCGGGETITSCAEDCASESAPSSWTCNSSYYAANDDCDCSCGAYDPDCNNETLRVLGCTDGQRCNISGQCEAAPTLPSSWTCSARFYEAGDACHCECGAVDPDCARSDLAVSGCLDGQQCNASGLCEGTPGFDGPIDQGGETTCRVVPGKVFQPSPWWFMPLLWGVWGWYRSRRRVVE